MSTSAPWVVCPPTLYATHCRKHQIEILHTEARGPVYEGILHVRSDVYSTSRRDAAMPIDRYSELYCAYIADVPHATLRVTRAVRGELDCEPFYPPALLARYRNVISSASGFCIQKCVDPELKLARVLVEAAWLHGLREGNRIDLINAAERGVSYYLRLGYSLVEGSFFVHPRLKTRSYALLCCADPDAGAPLDHLFQGISNPVTQDDLATLVTLSRQRPRRQCMLD